jgi:hypothetical protein
VFTKDNFANFDKAAHVRLSDLVRVQFIDFIVVMKLDAEGGFWFPWHAG